MNRNRTIDANIELLIRAKKQQAKLEAEIQVYSEFLLKKLKRLKNKSYESKDYKAFLIEFEREVSDFEKLKKLLSQSQINKCKKVIHCKKLITKEK